MRKKFIEDNTFGSYLNFFWDCTEQEFLNKLNKRNGSKYQVNGAQGKSIYHEDDEHLSFSIWVNRKDNYETLSHEILHATRFWLQDYFKIDLTQETDEVYTLFHSFYMRECLKALKK